MLLSLLLQNQQPFQINKGTRESFEYKIIQNKRTR